MATIRISEHLSTDPSTEEIISTISKVYRERYREDIDLAFVRPELFSKAVAKKAANFKMVSDGKLPADTVAVKGRHHSALFIF